MMPLRSAQKERVVSRVLGPGFRVTMRKMEERESGAVMGWVTMGAESGALGGFGSMLIGS
jgi:hypothetical protein